MIRQIRSGVAGMSTCRTPSRASASTTALITAGGEPMAPTSPHALHAQRVVGAGGDLGGDLEPGQVVGPRHGVVHEASRRGAGRTRRSVQSSSSAWPMPWATPPCTWPSTIIGLMTRPTSSTAVKATTCVTAGLGVDLDLADVAAAGIGEVLGVVEGGLLQAGLEARSGSCAGRRRRGRSRPASSSGRCRPRGRLPSVELDVGLARLQQVGGDLAALGDDLVGRLDHRGAADGQRARAVGAHAEGDLAVSPWTMSICSSGTPSCSATSCAKVVSWPWPWLCVPVNTVTLPVGCTRMVPDS